MLCSFSFSSFWKLLSLKPGPYSEIHMHTVLWRSIMCRLVSITAIRIIASAPFAYFYSTSPLFSEQFYCGLQCVLHALC